jgi:hypothetical protein
VAESSLQSRAIPGSKAQAHFQQRFFPVFLSRGAGNPDGSPGGPPSPKRRPISGKTKHVGDGGTRASVPVCHKVEARPAHVYDIP